MFDHWIINLRNPTEKKTYSRTRKCGRGKWNTFFSDKINSKRVLDVCVGEFFFLTTFKKNH